MKVSQMLFIILAEILKTFAIYFTEDTQFNFRYSNNGLYTVRFERDKLNGEIELINDTIEVNINPKNNVVTTSWSLPSFENDICDISVKWDIKDLNTIGKNIYDLYVASKDLWGIEYGMTTRFKKDCYAINSGNNNVLRNIDVKISEIW